MNLHTVKLRYLRSGFRFAFGLLAATSLSLPLTVAAQSDNFSPLAEATQNDGRFSFGIGALDGNFSRMSNGLISRLDIEVQWWTLIGQAVEIYGLKWEYGSRYNVDSGRYLTKSSLSKYPDLESRFDDLKPANIEVSFDVEFFVDGHGEGRSYSQDFQEALRETYYDRSGKATARKVTNNFLVDKSGKMMRDFSPSSPRDWQSFLEWPSYSKNGITKGHIVDHNEASKNTFQMAEKIKVTNLRITNIDLPVARARAIYEEYQRREKDKKDATDKVDNMWSNKAVNEQQNPPQSDNGLWSDNDEPETENEFWAEKNVNAQKPISGLWSDVSEEKTEGLENRQNSNSRKTEQENFKIEFRGGKWGVIDLDSGNTLIPFRDWKIKSYRSGLAQIVRESDGKLISEKDIRTPGTSGEYNACTYSKSIEKYWVNSSGKIVIPTQTKVEEYTVRYWVKCLQYNRGG